jgi:hypothetical protein
VKKLSRKSFLQQSIATFAALGIDAVFAKANNLFIDHATSSNVIYLTKTDAEYETLRKGFNKRINRYPQVIAVVMNQLGVQEAIAYAQQKQLPVTVKSGGHCMEGFSVSDGGMVINVSKLNQVTIDGNTLTLGPAAKLKSIYETILPKGKYLPGGSCQTVAIGGLTLGGGYGLMSRKFGLTCDSLINATMVDAFGKVHQSNKNATLHWALKGGGNGNFGVVTQLQFKLHTAPKTMKSIKFRKQNVTIPEAIEICKTWFQLSASLPNECFSAFIYNGKTTYIILTNTGAETETVKQFIKACKATATKITEGKPLPLATALKAYYAEANPITFKNASSGLYKSFDDIAPCIQNVFTLVKERPGILYQINTLGGAIKNDTFEKSSSFPHRAYAFFSELQAYWESTSATQKMLTQFEKIQEEFAKANINVQYRNYPDINFSNWQQQYYGQNLSQLQALKKQLDPNALFAGMQTL